MRSICGINLIIYINISYYIILCSEGKPIKDAFRSIWL